LKPSFPVESQDCVLVLSSAVSSHPEPTRLSLESFLVSSPYLPARAPGLSLMGLVWSYELRGGEIFRCPSGFLVLESPCWVSFSRYLHLVLRTFHFLVSFSINMLLGAQDRMVPPGPPLFMMIALDSPQGISPPCSKGFTSG